MSRLTDVDVDIDIHSTDVKPTSYILPNQGGPADEVLAVLRSPEFERILQERGPAIFKQDGGLLFAGEYIQRISGFPRSGGGMVKIIWKHGEKSKTDSRFQVTREDVVSLQDILNNYEPRGRMKIWKILPALPEHIPAIAAGMREADRLEVWASHRHSPAQALESALARADLAWTCMVEGEPAFMWGVSRLGGILSETGSPWLLGTSAIGKVVREFLRQSRAYVERMQAGFSRLENHVHAQNVLSIRWLKWCGFTILAMAGTLLGGIGQGLGQYNEWQKLNPATTDPYAAAKKAQNLKYHP
jgi:hypothetical protein